MQSKEALAAKFAALLPHLDERQRRLLMGAEARSLGHGGIKVVARAAGVSAATVSRGIDELEAGGDSLERIRKPGGGRKPVTYTDPGVSNALLGLLEPGSRGDPQSPLRWTTKSMRRLQTELAAVGHPISVSTVAKLLKAEGFSLQGNAKTIRGATHPDRDAQFHYLNDQATDHLDSGDPVISVDTKKRELVGEFRSVGRERLPRGQPQRVNTRDVTDTDRANGIPYGVYHAAADAGWVSVGTDHDTAEFAVATIATWWHKAGSAAYPHSSRLLITADGGGGGSNGYRTRLCTTELACLAEDTGLIITVCHLPPGTRKWNRIEHRLFSHISMNWSGRSLTGHEVIVNAIAPTSTRTALSATAELGNARHPAGIKITDQTEHDLEPTPLRRHTFHGDWNYSLTPNPSEPERVRSPAPTTMRNN